MKHTEGPWSVEIGDSEKRSMSLVFKDNKDFPVAWVICEDRNRPQREQDIANAELISSAPDMQDALQAIFSDCDQFLDGDMDISPTALIRAIRATAAKFATGE